MGDGRKMDDGIDALKHVAPADLGNIADFTDFHVRPDFEDRPPAHERAHRMPACAKLSDQMASHETRRAGDKNQR